MSNISIDSPAVQSYVTILQSVINRMANNSAACKTWCITIISAILIIIADKNKPDLIWIATIPLVLFLFLDSYYLALEKLFRDTYNNFIKKLHSGNATIEDTFLLSAGKISHILLSTFIALISFSVFPFYLLLSVMLFITKFYLLKI
jgi:hypothetical protein